MRHVVSLELYPGCRQSVLLQDARDFTSLSDAAVTHAHKQPWSQSTLRQPPTFYYFSADKKAIRITNSQELALALHLRPDQRELSQRRLQLYVIHSEPKGALDSNDDELQNLTPNVQVKEQPQCTRKLQSNTPESVPHSQTPKKPLIDHEGRERNNVQAGPLELVHVHGAHERARPDSKRFEPALVPGGWTPRTSGHRHHLRQQQQHQRCRSLEALASGRVRNGQALVEFVRENIAAVNTNSPLPPTLHALTSTLNQMTLSSREHVLNSLMPWIANTALADRRAAPRLLPTQASITIERKRVLALLCNAFLCSFSEDEMREFSFHHIFATESRERNTSAQCKLESMFCYFSLCRTQPPSGTLSLRIAGPAALSSDALLQCRNLVLPMLAPPGSHLSDTPLQSIVIDSRSQQFCMSALFEGETDDDILLFEHPESLLLAAYERCDAKALALVGVERFNTTSAASGRRRFLRAASERRHRSIACVDAFSYRGRDPLDQFRNDLMLRDVDKAVTAYLLLDGEKVAVHGWGTDTCKKGDPMLKFLLQSVAAAFVGKQIVFYDEASPLVSHLRGICELLHSSRVRVSRVWDFLCRYEPSHGHLFAELANDLRANPH